MYMASSFFCMLISVFSVMKKDFFSMIDIFLFTLKFKMMKLVSEKNLFMYINMFLIFFFECIKDMSVSWIMIIVGLIFFIFNFLNTDMGIKFIFIFSLYNVLLWSEVLMLQGLLKYFSFFIFWGNLFYSNVMYFFINVNVLNLLSFFFLDKMFFLNII